MSFLCGIRIADDGIRINAPEGQMLPGRMLRALMQNLENHYQVLEFVLAKNDKDLRELEREGVLQKVSLSSGFLPALFGHQTVAFLGLHPSFYDENYVELSDSEIEEYRASIPQGEEMYVADFTVQVDTDFSALVTDDLNHFCKVASHLKLRDFPSMQECARRLGTALITIYDELELVVEYRDPALADIILAGLDEWLDTPVRVPSLND